MQQPQNAEVIENPIFTMWLDNAGILCFVSKKHPPQKLEDTTKLFADIRGASREKKRCMLMDLTHFQMPSKESRDYGDVELPKMVTAIAMLSRSELGTFVANTYFKIKPQPYPTKVFTDEHEAREWLKQYL